MSGATFIRDFVYNHPAYKQDSVVSKEISCDLIEMLQSLDTPNSEARTKLLSEAFA